MVFFVKVRQATLIRVGGKTNASINITRGGTLDILVENMGRINYGPHLQDPKGIIGNVTLGEVVLRNWLMYPLDFDRMMTTAMPMYGDEGGEELDNHIPSFYSGIIPPTPDGIPRDTFLKLPGWFKVRCLCFSIGESNFAPLFFFFFVYLRLMIGRKISRNVVGQSGASVNE